MEALLNSCIHGYHVYKDILDLSLPKNLLVGMCAAATVVGHLLHVLLCVLQFVFVSLWHNNTYRVTEQENTKS